MHPSFGPCSAKNTKRDLLGHAETKTDVYQAVYAYGLCVTLSWTNQAEEHDGCTVPSVFTSTDTNNIPVVLTLVQTANLALDSRWLLDSSQVRSSFD